MRKVFPATSWRPDLADNGHSGLTMARGVYHTSNGYTPVRSFEAATPVLAGWNGGTAFVAKEGTSVFLSGTATNLYRFSGSTWSSLLGGLTAGRWRFVQFINAVSGLDLGIGVHGGAPVKVDLVSGVAAPLGGSPPNAKYICVAGDFVVLAGDEANNSTVTWSGIENAEGWTVGVNQSEKFPIPDNGRITGLTGHESYFLAYQRDAINRFSYVGVPNVFARDKISQNVGCVAPYSLAQAGNLAFFLSERGFMQTDGSSVTPIGYEKVDESFRKAHEGQFDRIYAAIDPRKFIYHVAVPGNPGRLWSYNWLTTEWSDAELSLAGLFSAFTANVSLDALDAIYPGGIDTIPVSLDSVIFQGGDPRLYAVDHTGIVGALTGPNMAAIFEWPYQELGGLRSRPHRLMPITDCTTGMTATIRAKSRLGDSGKLVATSELTASGSQPVRANGRYMKFREEIAAGQQWSHFQALRVDYGFGGDR